MVRTLGRGLVLGGSLCVATFSFNGCSAKSTEAPAADGGAVTNPADGGSDGSTPGSDGSTPADDGATKSALGFTPSNIDVSGIDLTKVGDFIVDNDGCTIDSETNLASCGDGAGVLGFKLATQTDGSKVAVYVARTMNIPAGKKLTVEGSNPLVFVALDTITIAGSFNGNSSNDVAIAGGQSQLTPRSKGAGPGGGNASPSAAGAGGSYCGVGGAGASESGTATTGGATYGSDAITPLVGGSSGGSGDGAGAGSGGGALQLVAGKSITIDASGLIHVGAGGGGFGGISTQDAAGGGSGGSILLESLAVSVAGTLAANGGGGGGGSAQNIPGGQNAFGSAMPAAGGAAPSEGGAGSAAAVTKGTDGTFTAGGGSAGGGGGGGAGRIRINTKLGQATLTGTLSPSAATTCATQGTVKP
jgi:hypothetical protein